MQKNCIVLEVIFLWTKKEVKQSNWTKRNKWAMLPEEWKKRRVRMWAHAHNQNKEHFVRMRYREKNKLTEVKRNCFVSSPSSLCFQNCSHSKTHEYTPTHTQTHTIHIEINNKTIIFFDTSIFTTFKQSPKNMPGV